MESDNTCRTCSAIPGKIVEVSESDHSALVDVAGVTRQVDLMLMQDENPAPGEWILDPRRVCSKLRSPKTMPSAICI